MKRLQKALGVAEEKNNTKEANDKLIVAQIQFLQKNVDEALVFEGVDRIEVN